VGKTLGALEVDSRQRDVCKEIEARRAQRPAA
jgi:hypothetical protein